MTYGDLVNIINEEGLLLCSDLRLEQQIKKEQLNSKNELGNFCEQVGLQPFKTQKPKKPKKLCKDCYKERTQSFREKTKSLEKGKKPKLPQYRPEKPSWPRTKTSPPICYKCGRMGHFSQDCKIKINK